MWRSSALLPLLAAAVLATGCVEVSLREAGVAPDYTPLLLPPTPEPTPGAIWHGDRRSGSFLFYDRKARGVGDLVTVRVVERFSAEGTASTSVDKSASLGASLSSDVGLGQAASQAMRWLLGKLLVDDPGVEAGPADTVSVVESSTESSFAGDGETSREGLFQAVVTCRVLAQHPNGILHVRGRRTIVVNHELQLLTVEGLVRREDIGIDNSVGSSALAEARLTLDGIGVVSDKQRVPLFARVMDWLYPF